MSVCFVQIETKKLTRNRSVRKNIHTNESREKTGGLIYQGILIAVNVQLFEFNSMFDPIKFPRDKRMNFEVTLSILSALSQFACLVWLSRLAPILTLQYSLLISDISTFAQLTMAAGRGEGASTSDSVCPSSPGPDIYHRLKLSFLPCLIPLIYDTSQCSNCLFWRGWGWAESLLDWKAKYWDCRKKQDPTSLVWARAGRRKRWQRVRGGKSGIVHSPLKSSPDHRSLKSRKKPPGRGVMCDGGGSRRMRQ